MKSALLITCVLFSFLSNAQIFKYYFDEKFYDADKDKAIINANAAKTANGVTAEFYLIKENRLLLKTDFTDSTLTIRNGVNKEYHKNGKIAVINFYKKEVLDSVELKWNEKGLLTDSVIYDNGKKMLTTINRYNEDKLIQKSIENIQDATLNATEYDKSGAVSNEVFFKGDQGVIKRYKAGALISTDSLYTRKSTNAFFPHELGSWSKFLEENLDAGMLIRKGATGGSGTVIAEFVIEEDGAVSNIKTLTNIGYGAEEEVRRVLKKSPKWTPATQYGLPVKAHRRQPVTFAIKR